MAKTFYVLDYETFGTSPANDRPCQFAGVRVDMNLNVVSKPLIQYCQPLQDYLPAPEAALVTGITPQKAMSEGVPEKDFIDNILAELSAPNTISLGYNSIRFDDEVTRYTAYRNLRDPYSWAWRNGNSRWDLIDVLRTCYALRPDGINWVHDEDGRPSFKLDRLAPANGLDHSDAHDAYADIVATIEMAKKVKQGQPKLWDYLLGLRSKAALNELIDFDHCTPLLHVNSCFGWRTAYTSWIVPIVREPDNANSVIAIDLQKDLSGLLSMDAESIRNTLYTKRSELPNGVEPMPIIKIQLNKCPILAPAKTLTPMDAERIGIDRNACLHNLDIIKQSPELKTKLVEVFGVTRDFPKKAVDAQLYDGFFCDDDRTAMDTLIQLNPDKLCNHGLSFHDERIEPLLALYRGRYYPDGLTQQETEVWRMHCEENVNSKIDEYLYHLHELAVTHQQSSRNLAILKSLHQYAMELSGTSIEA